MANNRMYLVNGRTGARIQIAKFNPSTGWYLSTDSNTIHAAFHQADYGEHPEHPSEEQVGEAALSTPGPLLPGERDVPYQAFGGNVGDTSWRIEYEELRA